MKPVTPLHNYRRGQDAVIAAIETRMAEWTRLPPSHGEPIQVQQLGGSKFAWLQCVTGPALLLLILAAVSIGMGEHG